MTGRGVREMRDKLAVEILGIAQEDTLFLFALRFQDGDGGTKKQAA